MKLGIFLLVLTFASLTAAKKPRFLFDDDYPFDCELPPGCEFNKTQKFLLMYGYLDPEKPCIKDDMETALTMFQTLNKGLRDLEVTGRCDEITNLVMDLPRCGCEDIVKFEKKMMPTNLLGPQNFVTGNTKWDHKILKWYVERYPSMPHNRHLSNGQVDDAMRRGLQIWADVSSLSFAQTRSKQEADIVISFLRLRHTRDPPYYDFDGKGGVLAHAFFPQSGVVHFDDDEHFVLNSNEGTELYIVAAHEFGHTLGISHSNIQSALMAPYYRYSEKLQLDNDDIQAIQHIYGPPTNKPTTPTTRRTVRPTNPPRTLPPVTRPPVTRPRPRPDVPDYCNLRIKASFKLGDNTYIFTREREGRMRIKTFVYRVHDNDGLIYNSRKPINEMFRKRSSRRYPRAHPWRVDAASYIPHKGYLFLFSGTRAYRYTVGSERSTGPFYLDTEDNFPRWMDVSEFPERPRAAVAMPYRNYNAYYMLIFGSTMVWDWNFFTQRVGAWAYPINVFGRNMPLKVDSGFLDRRSGNAIFVRGTQYYEFSLRYRRVLGESSIKDVKKNLFKGMCV